MTAAVDPFFAISISRLAHAMKASGASHSIDGTGPT